MTVLEPRAASDSLIPRRSDKFSFGLWTIGWQGNDPFGLATRPALDVTEAVERLADLGAYGVTLHDDDLFAFGSSDSERRRMIDRLSSALSATGLVVPMVTTNLFTQPVFKDGGFTSNDRAVRRFALRKVLRNIDLAAELGAHTFVMWGGREGSEYDSAKDVRAALERYREALDLLCEYVIDQDIGIRFAIEPKPNEPRGDILLPTVGHALAFIETLAHPDMVGVNPETGHEQMAGLNFMHGISQALYSDKLFHIDLNDQVIGRYDQDFRFGAANPKAAFWLVKFLEEVGYAGPRHFDAHAYRTEGLEGVKDFARGCMRTYLILKDKAVRWIADPEISELVAELDRGSQPSPPIGQYSDATARALREHRFDRQALGARELAYERLDQLTIEILLGVRSPPG